MFGRRLLWKRLIRKLIHGEIDPLERMFADHKKDIAVRDAEVSKAIEDLRTKITKILDSQNQQPKIQLIKQPTARKRHRVNKVAGS